jgi:hypothetical protein
MATTDELIAAANKARAEAKQVMRERPPRSAPRAERDAWYARYLAAQFAYAAAEAATGYGPGVSTRE